MKSSLELWVTGVIGQRLTSVRASLFAFSDAIDYENPQQISLDFGAPGSGYITCSSDGSSLDFASGSLDAFDMGEAGRRVLADMSNQPIFSRIIGKKLRRVTLSKELSNSAPVALSFYFEDNELHIANLGDDMFVYSKYPASSFNGGAMNFVSFE